MNAVSVLRDMGLSVRLDEEGALVLGGLKSLPPEDRGAAVRLARENKTAIVEALQMASPVAHTEEQHAAALAHARRLLVPCPATGGKLHCWHCSRCDKARSCRAWRGRRADVEFFRQSEEPFSLFLVEQEACGVIQ